jgi:cysteine desulfurase
MHYLPCVGVQESMRRPIYFDYHATTPIDPRVARVVYDCALNVPGNPGSEHLPGDEADAVIRRARVEVARLVGSSTSGVVFTSGATESINLAIRGFARQLARTRPGERFVVALTTVEHKAVAEVCRSLVDDGVAEAVEVPVDHCGRVDLTQFARACARGAHLACVMAANNEIGTVYPLQEIASIARRHGTRLLTDATQAVGRVPVEFDNWGIDFLALSGHKLYGPKGVGALVVRALKSIDPVFTGGGQESGLRPGTLNVPGIVGLGEACRLRSVEMNVDERVVRQQRDRLESLLLGSLPNLTINGDREHRLAGNLHVSIPGIPGSAVVARLRNSVAISTGSACSSGAEGPSHVLRALGVSDEAANGALRISIGKFTTDEDVEVGARLIAEGVRLVLTAVEEAHT